MMKKAIVASAFAALASTSASVLAVDGKGVYQAVCIACHGTGAAGAPKTGDQAAWAPRIEKGMDALLQSSINGIPGTSMLPRGTCNKCSDAELEAAVEYMVEQSR